ncbi:helix-turn-helix domain-containing protein [Pedobacter hartonius]|uniref:Transcriptional regulator, AraC family n=1 Tax=Pedobacter hartonius TaxID=425514 RepID=A0A1H3W179_9SPHI|nr:helix-turn-helix domain-containing protein [Pedobacter hartonius]SDZ80062.1 transcriptional regulator, AraC family [Pedobacter hartonius]
MTRIPVHILKDRTDLGFQLKNFSKGSYNEDDEKVNGVHRDDHYIFFVLEKGSGMINIDFKEVEIPEGSLYYILPSQVHQRIRTSGASGWFIAVETSLLPPECRSVFEGHLFLQRPFKLKESHLDRCNQLLHLLFLKYREERTNNFSIMELHSLVRSFLAMAAGCYNSGEGLHDKIYRPAQISAHFRKLLAEDFRTVKGPAEYATKLNISETYLSEAVKKTTGFPASYWIHQEVIMEAKRLLYYSNLTVKEIAHDLGYADHSYFSRLFRKTTGSTANQFREQYLK